MNNLQKAKKSIDEATSLLRNKPIESTLVERYFLLYEAWDKVIDLAQPLQLGKGLYYVLSKASLPIKKHDMLLGRYDDHVPNEKEQARLSELWKRAPDQNPIVRSNDGHRTLEFKALLDNGIPGYLSLVENQIDIAKSNGAIQNELDFLEGIRWVYKSILLYVERYGLEAHNAGLHECANVCNSLKKGKPKTFREALQLILFIYN